jgi:ketosteroid isomerase-like protein
VNAWKLTGTRPDGQAIALEGLSSDVVRQQPDGRWLVIIDDPWGSTSG